MAVSLQLREQGRKDPHVSGQPKASAPLPFVLHRIHEEAGMKTKHQLYICFSLMFFCIGVFATLIVQAVSP